MLSQTKENLLLEEEISLKKISTFDIESAPRKSDTSGNSLTDSKSIEFMKSFEEVSNTRLLGIFFIMWWALSYTLAVFAWKWAYRVNSHLTGFDYILWRSFTIFFAVIQTMVTKVNVLNVKKGYRLLLFIRCITGTIGIPWFFIGLKYIPTSKAALITNSSPIFVAVAAYFVLKENITKSKIFGILGAFLGVFIFTYSQNSQDDGNTYAIGIVLVSITCVYQVGVSILLRILNQHIHYALSPFWFATTTLTLSLVLVAVYPSLFNFKYYTWESMMWFMISGVFNFAAQNFKSLAYKYDDASFIAPFQYFPILFLFLWDLVVFEISFTSTDIIGGLIIVAWLLTPVLERVFQNC